MDDGGGSSSGGFSPTDGHSPEPGDLGDAAGGNTPQESGNPQEEEYGEPPQGAPAPAGGSREGGRGFVADERLVQAYMAAAKEAGRKVNHCVHRSLSESAAAGRDTWFIEAPGNHKLTFSSRLGDEDMLVFAKCFEGLVPGLARLDLSHNNITDVGAEPLARALLGERAARLTNLSLRANSIGPKGCDILCQALRHCPILRRLDMSQNPLERAGGLMIVELLQGKKDLMELFVADTEIDIDVIVAISAVLLTGVPQLKVCNIENPRIGTLQEDHTVHMGRMLRVNTQLTEFYLGKHRMRDDGVRQFVSFLLENKTLRVLDLRCNELGAEGAQHLGTFLASDCQLSRLNLSGNRIGEKSNVSGARAIADALRKNRMLRHLDLNRNSLCGEALQLLAEAVDENSTLESIALFHSDWNQHAAYKFHHILNDRARLLPLRADFITDEVDLRIDICKVDAFQP